MTETAADSFYSMSAPSLEGKEVDLSDFTGKVTLVVNVASECGFTPQYAGLQELHEEFEEQGFAVLGFPSNEFGGQEPGGAADIKEFCERNYGVSFPMFAKVEVQPGPGQSPVFQYLTRGGDVPDWNFCKFLVGRDGRRFAYFRSRVAPDAPELRAAIEKALAG